ncbi:MAG: winged helix-turn-helix transcriptional regulator, partial [Coriobacteriales bacterium]|nr:winged helix-turn-helix transcriptional regulator [Coriobacteriales bacterium]
NPILARFFVNIGFADTLGSGVRNLYRYTKIYSGKEPELIEGDIFQTIIPLNRTPDVLLNVPINVSINETDSRILEIIEKNPKTTYASLAEELFVSSRTVQRSISKLQEAGKITRVGSKKTGYWKIAANDVEQTNQH